MRPTLPSTSSAAAMLAALLASCGQPPREQNAEVPAENGAAQPLPSNSAASGPAANESADIPSTNAIVAETPFSPESAQGAANVVQTYYALIEAGKYEDARHLRWDFDELAAGDFAAGFARYADYHATIGAPSEIQGAAGSLYVEVPVQTYGHLRNGMPFGQAGTVTLRRVNDVPGSTPEQRRWRIYTSE